MIQEYVSDIASHMGMKPSKVSLSGGPDVSCSDYLLHIESKNRVVITLINQSDLDSIEKCSASGFLELRIKTALERLKIQLEP